MLSARLWVGCVLFPTAVAVACSGSASAAGFTVVNAMGLGDVAAMATDDRGFVWSAGADGVCRNSGVSWTCPSARPAVAIASAGHGRVWAALGDGEVVEMSVAGVVRTLGARFGDVAGLVVDERGALIIAGRDGAARVDDLATCASAHCRVTHLTSQPAQALIASQGRIMFATGAEVWQVAGAAARHIWTAPEPVTALGGGATGWVAGTRSGQYFQWREGQQPTLIWQRAGNASRAIVHWDGAWLSGSESHGLTWLGTGDGRTEAIPAVAHHQVLALLTDASGGLWVGTRAGVSRVRARVAMRTLGREQGLSSLGVFSVAEARDGRIWFSATEGVSFWNGERFGNFGVDQGFPHLDLRGVADGSEGIVTAGLMSGAFRLSQSPPAVTRYRAAGADRSLRGIWERREGGYWIAPWVGGLAILRAGQVEPVWPAAPGGTNLVFDLAQGPAGDLWLALSYGGVAHQLPDGSFETWGRSHGLPPAEVVALLPLDSSTVWLATNGDGLIRLQNGSVSGRVTQRNGLVDDHIFSLVADGRGSVWMSSPQALSGVPQAELARAFADETARFAPKVFHLGADFPGEPVRTFARPALAARDGTVWFPSLRGAIQLDPAAITPVPSPGAPSFDAVWVGGTLLRPGVAIAAARQYELSAQYATSQYDWADRMRFDHKLDGLDEAWRPSDRSGIARYERVPPGRYVLRVRVKLEQGGSAERTVTIDLPKPWFDQLPARSTLILLPFFGVAAFYKHRARRARTEQATLLAERNRIAGDIHDSLEQDLTGLRLQVGAAEMNLDARPELTREHLQQSLGLLEDAVVDLRHSIWSLRGGMLNSRDLIASLAARFARTTLGLKTVVIVTGVGAPRSLPATTVGHLVHVAREAVANALKHATATQINVTLDMQPDATCLRIADDGRGVTLAPSTAPGHGHGMGNMRRRAAALGGEIFVSTAESGTTIELRIPRTPERM